MTTWGQVRLGDTVRGADQRPWEVTYRGAVNAWVAQGGTSLFGLRCGEREVKIWRRLADAVELVQRADHAAEAGALDALINTFGTVEIREESRVEQFAAPAAPGPKFDRFGRYLLPDPQTGAERAFTRATTVARTLADDYGLTQWKLRMVAKGMALRPDLVAGAAAADPEADKKDLQGIAQQALDAAESRAGANLGTALHTATRRIDAGEAPAALRMPPPLDADLAAYAALLKRERLRVEHSERIVVLPGLGIAGQLDRIVRQPPGVAKSEPLSVLDLKTGRDLDYSWLEIAIQLAIYTRGTHLWDPATRTYTPMPTVDQHRALVCHLPVGRAAPTLYGVDIQTGWELARKALSVRADRAGAKRLAWLVEPHDAHATAMQRVSSATSRQELARLWDELHRADLWSEEVDREAKRRYEEIQLQATVQ